MNTPPLSIGHGRFAWLTARAAGAIGAFRVTAPESMLARHIDVALRPFPRWTAVFPADGGGEIAHGRWLDRHDEPVDEILLARTRPGERILTGHGGPAAMAALARSLRERGFQEAESASDVRWPHFFDARASASLPDAAFPEKERPGTGSGALPPRLPAVPAHGKDAVPEPLESCGDEDREALAVAAEVDARLPFVRTAAQAAFLLTARQRLPARLAAARRRGPRPALDPTEDAEELPRAEGLLRTRRVALAGAPNAGKSALFNALVGHARALVHATAGTTLDVVAEEIDVGGYAVLLHDLPGGRATDSPLEREAMRRAESLLPAMDVALWVRDGRRPPTPDDRRAARFLRRLQRDAAEAGNMPLIVGIACTHGDLAPDPPGQPSPSGAEAPPSPSGTSGPAMDWPILTTSAPPYGEPGGLEAVLAFLIQSLGGGWDGTPWPFTRRQAEILQSRAGALA